MAKSNDNNGAAKPDDVPENVPVFAPSALVMQALGDHAEQQGLVQVEGEAEIDFAVRCISALNAALVEATGKLVATNRRLASQKGVTTKVKARITEMEEAGKPRALGPMAAVFDDPAEAFTPVDILVAVDAAEQVVLAFSDGAAELRGIKPRQVRAAAFQLKRGRLLFTDEPLEVTGPGNADTVTTLAGVALLVDGEQVGWSPMPMPIAIGAGQTINLAGSVIFG